MTSFVKTVTDLLTFSVLLLDIFAVGLFIILITPLKRSGWTKKVATFFGERAILFSFLVVLASVLSSLFYSEIARFQPCVLCWWQRVFLYPQLFLLFTALIKKDENVRRYAIVLSIAGALVALYHTLLQLGFESSLPCPATGGISCQVVYFLDYGYITIPTMALTAFVLILLFLASPNPKKKEVIEV
jgi:disulfide bond formation protein DsbB